MSEITLFQAKKIITMDRNRPEATHVAVRDGVILAVGGPDCAEGWGAARLDDRFADKVMLPGLVEAHAHASAGGIWRYIYCGHYARTDPDGVVWPGLGTTGAVIDRLAGIDAAMERPDAPLVGWGSIRTRSPGRGSTSRISTGSRSPARWWCGIRIST